MVNVLCIISILRLTSSNSMNFASTVKALLKLDTIRQALSEEEQKELNLAITELMLEMIRADFIELHKEKKVLIELLSESFNMERNVVLAHIEKAELRADFSLSIKTQTNVINNYLNKTEKAVLLKNMWLLAKADDELHLLETQLIDKAGQLLGFSPQELSGLCQ